MDINNTYNSISVENKQVNAFSDENDVTTSDRLLKMADLLGEGRRPNFNSNS